LRGLGDRPVLHPTAGARGGETFFRHPHLEAAVGRALLDSGEATIATDTPNAE
jgi:hypothetical protein